MAEEFSSLRIVVEPSPATNDHEVRLFDGRDDLIQRFDDSMMGLDPDEILITPCPLVPRATPHRITIARCDCGVTECGSVDVLVERTGDVVVWRSAHSTVTARFSAAQYDEEVARALGDLSWETPDRTAGRLVSLNVDRASLSHRGFEYIWASGRIVTGCVTVALTLTRGPYQILVNVPWDGASPEIAAAQCVTTLADNPATWDVVWYPQSQGLGPPDVAGPKWRAGTA